VLLAPGRQIQAVRTERHPVTEPDMTTRRRSGTEDGFLPSPEGIALAVTQVMAGRAFEHEWPSLPRIVAIHQPKPQERRFC
jgi:hypothetical protein